MSAFNQGFVPQESSAALPGYTSSCMSPRHIREMPWPLRLFGLTPSSVACSFTFEDCPSRVTFLFFLSSNFQITLTVSACSSNLPLVGIHSFVNLTF